MPMTLDGIQDESNYQIDDRQFYGQSYNIKVMAYIITEEDYRVEQIPLKKKMFNGPIVKTKTKADIEIDEEEHELVITFPSGCNKAKFTIDCDFETEKQDMVNIKSNNIKKIENNTIIEEFKYSYTLVVNGFEIIGNKYIFKENDEIEIKIKKINEKEVAMIKFL
jgi:hypothetical protein